MVVQVEDRNSTSSSSPTVSVGIPVCEDLAFGTPKGGSPGFPSTLDDQFRRSTPKKDDNQGSSDTDNQGKLVDFEFWMQKVSLCSSLQVYLIGSSW